MNLKTIKTYCVIAALYATAFMSVEAEPLEKSHAEIWAGMQKDDHIARWQRYPLLGLPLVRSTPKIDGCVDTREWAESAKLSYLLNLGNGMLSQDKIAVYACYSETHLYMAFQIERPKEAKKPTDHDFFEVLFDTQHGHKKYCNAAFAIENKILWDGIGPNVDKKLWNPAWEYKSRLTDMGWEGEISVAFKDFPGYEKAPEPGTVWGADFVRNEQTPYDRIAIWGWRSDWSRVGDLSHLLFTGKSLGVQVKEAGWMPDHRKMGAKLQFVNTSDLPIDVECSMEMRRADKKMPMGYYKTLDSALTDDLSAAISSSAAQEIQNALSQYTVIKTEQQTISIPANCAEQLVLTEPETPGDYLISFTAKSDGRLLDAMTIPFQVNVPLDIQLRSYLYSAETLEVTVDLRRAHDKITPTSVLKIDALELAGGKVVATAEKLKITHDEEVCLPLKFLPIPSATYTITATIIDQERRIVTNSVPLIVPPKPEWLGNSIGKKAFVPEPWRPLEADDRSCKTSTIDYQWNRSSIFPGIRVKGLEILARPVELFFMDTRQQPVPFELTGFSLKSQTPEEAVYSFSGQLGPLGRLDGMVKIEFDGFIWYDITLTPEAKVKLGKCRLDIALKPEFARLYTLGRIMTSESLNLKSGRVPEEGFAIPFNYQVWLGNVSGGLQWYAENNRNWVNVDGKRAITVKPEGSATVLSVNLVDAETAYEVPVTWSFGFIPTPSKTLQGSNEDYSFYQFYGLPPIKTVQDSISSKDKSSKEYLDAVKTIEFLQSGLKAKGVKAVIIFGGWSDVWGYPGVLNQETGQDLELLVKILHPQGIKVLVFAGWGFSTKAPEWEKYSSEIVKTPLKNCGWDSYWPHPSTLYPDIFLYRLAETIRKYDIDGIYMDSTTGIEFSTNYKDMRWTDSRGEIQGSYSLRPMREFTKRIYKLLHGELKKDGIYYNHHSGPANVCVENFTDVRCPSEFAQSYDGPLSQEFVDYFIAKNGGVQYGYRAELTNKNWVKGINKTIAQLLPLTIPLNITFKQVKFFAPINNYSKESQPMPSINRAMEWLGSRDAEYLPWWANGKYVSAEPGENVLSGLWLRKGEKALLCISNLDDKQRDISVTLDQKQIGFVPGIIEDAITGKIVEGKDGKITLSIEPERYRLLKIK